MLVERLRAALARINPRVRSEAREEALRKLTRVDSPNLAEHNTSSTGYSSRACRSRTAPMKPA